MLERERERVAAASRRLAEEGVVLGTSGNVSERAGDYLAITPTGAVLAELGPAEVTVVDLDGEHVDGELAATSELGLHMGVYRRYDAGAVVHAHPPIGTALSCVLDEVPVVHYQMLSLGGTVRVAPYATFGTPELAELTLEALRERSAALMANHGTITYGPDLDFAVAQSLLLEWACELYWRAAVVGSPRALSADQQQAVIDQVVRRGYGSPQRVTP
jgi:L-fuculose-phosphate aldolase